MMNREFYAQYTNDFPFLVKKQKNKNNDEPYMVSLSYNVGS